MAVSARWRILLLIVLLAAAGWFLYGQAITPRPGMTEQPCGADGKSVTGRARDDWARLCFYRAENAALKASGKRPEVVMIGDSITFGWQGLSSQFANRGINGQTSGQVLIRFRHDAVALEPRIVHVLVGTNDIAGHNGPTSPDMVIANIASIVDIARASGIVPVLATVPPATRFPDYSAAKPKPWIPRLNSLIRSYATDQDVILADYHHALAGPEGMPKEGLFADPLHPGAAGYSVMRPVLEAALDKARDRKSSATTR